MANYGGEKILENQLRKELKDMQALGDALTVLTAPEELSFYQQEEIELAETTDLKAHAKKFAWIKDSYAGCVKLTLDFFSERKPTIPRDIRKQLAEHITEAQEAKKELQARLSLSAQTMQIAYVLSESIAWQDHRKSVIFKYISYEDRLLDEMVRRRNWIRDEAVNFVSSELRDYFLGKKDLRKEFKSRMDGFTILLWDSQTILGKSDTDALWKYYLEDPKRAPPNTNELSGTVASKGANPVVRGKIRILLNPLEINRIRNGEVLVAPMTSPEYVFAMKKAVAIVTDTGGLTSHAAIVSRELKKPCIVGTKFATKIFKDGDFVEVNANTGIVRRLKERDV